MLSGAHISRQTIHCLLARGHRLLTDHLSYSSAPIPCATIPDPSARALPHTHCWALSLIQYLLSSQSNISITFPPPLTSSSHTITQTPLHSLYDPSIDLSLSLDDIFDFEASYHIHFLEDLFPTTPITPKQYILRLLPLFPPPIHNNLSRIIHTYANSPQYTLGHVTLREHITFYSPNTQSFQYIEGIMHPNQSTPTPTLLTRTWLHHPSRGPNSRASLPHTLYHKTNLSNAPHSPLLTSRLLRSAIGYSPTLSFCETLNIQQKLYPPTLLTHMKNCIAHSSSISTSLLHPPIPPSLPPFLPAHRLHGR